MNSLLFAALVALAAGSAPAASPAAVITVHIKNFAYVPPKVTVSAGTTVRFVNDDSEAHTVTANDKSFDSGGLDSNDVWSHRFAAAGTFPYFCAIHPYMHGTVVVTK